ncbi:MAG TPA: O-antigen ligase domain-containing protein [Gammaproteobacteria bacterium]|nr:O-antigen ligase domain-containing protein [Gammaproteobacteria bacterium]
MTIERILAVLLGLSFGLAALVLTPAKVLVLMATLLVFLIVMRKPLYGLILFAVLATSIPYTTIEIGVRTTISEAVLAVTWAGVFWHALIGLMRQRLSWQSAELSMLHLFLYSLIPLIYGVLMVSAEGSSIVNWLRWMLNLSVLFLVPLLLRTDADRDKVIVAFLSGSLLMLLVSIGYFLKDRDATTFIPLLETLRYSHPEAVIDIFSANYQRMASPWVHPNLTGGILALTVPLSLLYGWTRPGWRRFLGLSVAILGCAGLLFSISRGAILALLLVLFWLSYKRLPYSARIIALGAVLAVLLVMFYPPLQERLLSMFSASNASTGIRFDEYRMFPQAMATYPVGIGFKVDPPVPGSGLLGISNLWLNVIYKIGLPGLLLFSILIWRWWREVKPRNNITKITYENAIWVGSLSGVLAALTTGLFDHYYSFTFVIIALFWLLVGVSLQQVRLFPSKTSHA